MGKEAGKKLYGSHLCKSRMQDVREKRGESGRRRKESENKETGRMSAQAFVEKKKRLHFGFRI